MHLQHIKQKYRQILAQSDSEPSQEQDSPPRHTKAFNNTPNKAQQWIHSTTAPLKRTRTQTGKQNSSKTKVAWEGQMGVLAIKEQLAQSIANCKEQSKEVQRIKRQKDMHEQARKQWKIQIQDLTQQLQQQKTKNEHLEAVISKMQLQSEQLRKNIEQITLQRQLQAKQTEHYKKELGNMQQQIDNKHKEIRAFDKQYRNLCQVKKENQYLRQDVNRLSAIIKGSIRMGKVSSELMSKHFLGKPHKQLENWYPQQLVGQVEHFLKKHQVGAGNKEFTIDLIKFIEKYNQKTAKEAESRARAASASRMRLSESKNKQIKTAVNSVKKCSFVLEDESGWRNTQGGYSLGGLKHGCSLGGLKLGCWQIVAEFRAVALEMLLQKEIKRKKFKRLLDSMCDSLGQLLGEGSGKQVTFQCQDVGDLRLEMQDYSHPIK